MTVVPERAASHLRRTAAVRFLEPPLHLPSITEMLWWNPRHTLDPAHAWLRARIAEIAAELDRADSRRQHLAGTPETERGQPSAGTPETERGQPPAGTPETERGQPSAGTPETERTW